MEHISIEINKDFGRYKHNFFLGYTLSECFFFFLGGLCCVLIILPLGLLLHIDLFITGWCGVIPASAIIYIGNHQRNGMSEMEYQKKMYALKKMKKLTYQSEETQESALEILEEEISMKKAQENDIPRKKVKFPIQRMIKMAMLIGIVVGIFMTAMTILPQKVKQKQEAEGKQEAIRTQVLSKEESEKEPTTRQQEKTTTEQKKQKKEKQNKKSIDQSTRKTPKVEKITRTRKETTTERRITRKEETEAYRTRSSQSTTAVRKKSTQEKKTKPTKSTTYKKKKQETATTTAEKKKTPSKVTNQESQFEIEYETK